jgi:hypothetical protein
VPEIVTVRVPVRGRNLVVEIVRGDAADALSTQLHMLTLALVALEDPRVDAVLRAFGFEVRQGETVIGFDTPSEGK